MVGDGAGVAALVFGAFAGGVLVFGALAFGAVTFVAGVAVLTGAGVDVFTLFAGLLALFEAASPHAIPRALKPRTVESKITFFILFTNSYLSQRYI